MCELCTNGHLPGCGLISDIRKCKGCCPLKCEVSPHPNYVAVIGTRSPTDIQKEKVATLLERLNRVAAVIKTGGAEGVDSIAMQHAWKLSGVEWVNQTQ